MYFCYMSFVIISPWKRAGSSFEQTWIPIPHGCIVPSLVEIGPGVQEKIILILLMYYRYFLIISPKKRVDPSLEKNVNSLHPRMLCVKFGWNWPSGSGEEDENVKSLWQRQRQRTMDKFWSEKLTWAFSSGELKMKHS